LEVSETVLWFVVVPALIVLVIGALVYAMSGGQRSRRYRPGRPYDAAPVWFLSAPERFSEAARRRSVTSGQAPELAAGEVEAVRHAVPQGSTGGASDRW